MSKPFNPDYHSYIVRNYRNQWRETTNQELTLTDVEIYEVWRDHYMDAFEREGYEHYDQYVHTKLREAMDNKLNPPVVQEPSPDDLHAYMLEAALALSGTRKELAKTSIEDKLAAADLLNAQVKIEMALLRADNNSVDNVLVYIRATEKLVRSVRVDLLIEGEKTNAQAET